MPPRSFAFSGGTDTEGTARRERKVWAKSHRRADCAFPAHLPANHIGVRARIRAPDQCPAVRVNNNGADTSRSRRPIQLKLYVVPSPGQVIAHLSRHALLDTQKARAVNVR